MKAYPITEAELNQISWLGFLATLCFSLASACFAFWMSTEQAISFASEVRSEISNRWIGYQTMALVLGVIFGAGGIGLTGYGWNVRNQIKIETRFDEK